MAIRRSHFEMTKALRHGVRQGLLRLQGAGMLWILVILGCAALAQAQPDTLWTRIYGGPAAEHGSAMCILPEGGGLIVGDIYDTVPGRSDAFMLRFNSAGDLLWQRRTTRSTSYELRGVAANLLGEIYVAGTDFSDSPGGMKAYVEKTTPEGDTLWTRVLPMTSRGLGVTAIPDGGALLIGWKWVASHYHAYAARLTSDGDTLWTRTYVRDGRDPQDELRIALPSADGGFFLAGRCSDRPQFPLLRKFDMYVLKITSLGDTIWTRRLGNTADDEWVFAASFSVSGGIVLGGSQVALETGAYKMMAAELDGEGAVQWTWRFDTTNHHSYDSYITGITQLPDGQVEVRGGAELQRPGAPLAEWPVVVRFLPRGDTVWTRAFDPQQNFLSTASVGTPDGGYYLSGLVGFDYPDIWVARLEPTLNLPPRRSHIIVAALEFHGGYPNPFNARTEIRFLLPQMSRVTLTIYDLAGREVAVLANETYAAGEHSVAWNAAGLPSGVYFTRLHAGEFAATRKLLLLR